MPLSPGTRLGSYEVVSPIGAGGMGEVYRARDTKLNRDVAIKVLPELVGLDADRLARFTREAQVLASLNHPNIAAIYGIENRALVMELVEGEDLSAHIARGPLPLDEALTIARQIADALEAAHDQGIVHRDLKPANIKVRFDGAVKVLDFGLAKAFEPAAASGAEVANSPTLTAHATAMGIILGTAAYMSPEQARGRVVDKRTDVWAFGCVLYEMLSGKKAFDGEDATEIISAVVKTEPDWTALPADAPAHVRTVITRCLVKDRKGRIPDLSVARYMLEGAIPVAAASAVAPAPPRRFTRAWQVASALLMLTTLAAGTAWYRAANLPRAAVRFFIQPPDNLVFTAGGRPYSTVPVISPDGRTVAFTAQDAGGKRLLWLRSVDSLEAQPVTGTEGASYPFWSPDSRFIGYAIVGKLMKVAASGGPSTTLCALNPGIISRGGSWNRDGVIIFNNGPAPLYRVPSSGGEATVIGQLGDGESGREFPAFLPDGRHFLYHAAGPQEKGGVFVGSLDTAETRRVASSSTGAIFDRTSQRILFVRQGTLLAQTFDPSSFAVSGDPIPVAEHVEAAAVPGLVAFSPSDTGVLAYGVGEPAGSGLRLVLLDRTGKVLGTVGPEAQYRGVSISPDGSQVAAHRHDDEGGDIWLTDVARNSTSRFTFDATQENASPAWSPDGRLIAFSSTRDGKVGIYVKPSNNTGAEERFFENSGARFLAPFSWSPDGRSILFQLQGLKTSADLWLLSVSGRREAVPLLQSAFAEAHGQISPDGRWVAYDSNETGRSEIYVQPVSMRGGKWAVSTGGGGAPRWRADSRELYYIGNGKLWAVSITSKDDGLIPGTPVPLFDHAGFLNNIGHPAYFSYAVTKDGQRFLVTLGPAGGAALRAPIVVVINWDQALRK